MISLSLRTKDVPSVLPRSKHARHANLAPARQRLAYFGPAEERFSMKHEYHRWHSPRLGLDLGVVVYGHWGPPLMGFPTSAGDEWELENQGFIRGIGDLIDD